MEKKGLFLTLAVFVLLFFACEGFLMAGTFREDFAESYRNNQFLRMETLIKKKGAAVRAEVKSIIEEAMSEGKTFSERMSLLDLASTIATMHKHINGDAVPLLEVEALQREELGKEAERKAEAEKWRPYELYPGNILMRTKDREMREAGLNPVLFPHWVHRLYFECRACHESIFPMKRAPIAQASIEEGKSCGTCHNGKVSFAAKDNCQRCHLVGGPGEEAVLKASEPDLGDVEKKAALMGASLDAHKLKILPRDRFSYIDWIGMRESGAYGPLSSLERDSKPETRDTVIVFKSTVPTVKDVPFDHKTHTREAACSSCHPEPYAQEEGKSTRASMADMGDGMSCGLCHGRAAFKLADCNRCHTR